MTRTVKGRLVDDRTVILDEPLTGVLADVHVIVECAADRSVRQFSNVVEFLDSLPAGTRTREDIDQQIAEERASWNDER